jgi:magnesium transporter
MAGGVIKNINTGFKTQFVLILLYRIATRYLAYLKQIDKLTSFTEKQLHKNMRNKELIQLLDLNKSLVYFSTSLKSNQTTLDRILRGRNIKLYEEDRDLLEDVLIEIKQAIEMSQIYTQIINSMTDSIGAIINNNVNTVMKNLTLITILMAIPSIIFSFYGMNVDNLPLIDTPWFSIFVTVVLMGIAAVLLKRSSE